MKLYTWKLLTIRNSVNVVAINKPGPRRPVLEIELCCHLLFFTEVMFLLSPFLPSFLLLFHQAVGNFSKI